MSSIPAWPPELDGSLSSHARQVAHAAGNLCLIAELNAETDDHRQGNGALRSGLKNLRARAAMVARAQPALNASRPTMTWDALADAFRMVTAHDLEDRRAELTVEPPSMPVTWQEARPVSFFAFDLLAHALAAAGATKIWIKAAAEGDTLTMTIGGEATLPADVLMPMQRAVGTYGSKSPPPAGAGVFSMQMQL